MPDLRTIVQRMIDSGQDRETIDAAIERFKELNPPKPPPAPPTPPPYEGYPGPRKPDLSLPQGAPSESGSYWGGFFKPGGEADKAAFQGGLGFLQGAVADLPETIVGMAKDAGSLFTNPEQLLHAREAFMEGAPIVGKAMWDTAANAGEDPHAFGRMMGQLTGQPLVTELGIKAIPSVAREVAGGLPKTRNVVGAGIQGTGRFVKENTPITGVLPPIARPHTAYLAEKGLGAATEWVGGKIRPRSARPAVAGVGTDVGTIRGLKKPGMLSRKIGVREEAGGTPSRNVSTPYEANPIQQDIAGPPGEFVTPEPVEGNILAKPPKGVATRNQSVPFENQGPRPVPEPGGPPGEFDLTQPVENTAAVQPDFSGRTPSRYQSVPYEPGPVTDPFADLPSVGKNQRMPSGVREFDFGEPTAEPIPLGEAGNVTPSRFRDMPYNPGEFTEALKTTSENAGGRLTGNRVPSTDEALAQSVNQAFAEAEAARNVEPSVELPPPDYSQGAGAPPEQPRVDIRTSRTPTAGEESPYSHLSLEQMEEILAARKAGQQVEIPPKPAKNPAAEATKFEPSTKPEPAGARPLPPKNEPVRTPAGDLIDPATGELIEAVAAETPESIINASSLPPKAKATLLERLKNMNETGAVGEDIGPIIERQKAQRAALEAEAEPTPPGPEFTPVGGEPMVPPRLSSAAPIAGAAARPINPLRPEIPEGQLTNRKMSDLLTQRARAEAPAGDIFQEPPGGHEFVPVEEGARFADEVLPPEFGEPSAEAAFKAKWRAMGEIADQDLKSARVNLERGFGGYGGDPMEYVQAGLENLRKAKEGGFKDFSPNELKEYDALVEMVTENQGASETARSLRRNADIDVEGIKKPSLFRRAKEAADKFAADESGEVDFGDYEPPRKVSTGPWKENLTPEELAERRAYSDNLRSAMAMQGKQLPIFTDAELASSDFYRMLTRESEGIEFPDYAMNEGLPDLDRLQTREGMPVGPGEQRKALSRFFGSEEGSAKVPKWAEWLAEKIDPIREVTLQGKKFPVYTAEQFGKMRNSVNIRPAYLSETMPASGKPKDNLIYLDMMGGKESRPHIVEGPVRKSVGERARGVLGDETGSVGPDTPEMIAKNKAAREAAEAKKAEEGKTIKKLAVMNPSGEKIGTITITEGQIRRIKTVAKFKDFSDEKVIEGIRKKKLADLLEEHGFTEDQVTVQEFRPKITEPLTAEGKPKLVTPEGRKEPKSEDILTEVPTEELKPATPAVEAKEAKVKATKEKSEKMAPIPKEFAGPVKDRDVNKLSDSITVEEGSKAPKETSDYARPIVDPEEAFRGKGDIKPIKDAYDAMARSDVPDDVFQHIIPKVMRFPLEEGETWQARAKVLIDARGATKTEAPKPSTPKTEPTPKPEPETPLLRAKEYGKERTEPTGKGVKDKYTSVRGDKITTESGKKWGLAEETKLVNGLSYAREDRGIVNGLLGQATRDADAHGVTLAIKQPSGQNMGVIAAWYRQHGFVPKESTGIWIRKPQRRASTKWGGLGGAFKKDYPKFEASPSGEAALEAERKAFLKRHPYALFDEE